MSQSTLLQPLPVVIRDAAGNIVRTVELPDPRKLFIELFNRLSEFRGLTAEPSDGEGGAA